VTSGLTFYCDDFVLATDPDGQQLRADFGRARTAASPGTAIAAGSTPMKPEARDVD
jgi:hypothetical protein